MSYDITFFQLRADLDVKKANLLLQTEGRAFDDEQERRYQLDEINEVTPYWVRLIDPQMTYERIKYLVSRETARVSLKGKETTPKTQLFLYSQFPSAPMSDLVGEWCLSFELWGPEGTFTLGFTYGNVEEKLLFYASILPALASERIAIYDDDCIACGPDGAARLLSNAKEAVKKFADSLARET